MGLEGHVEEDEDGKVEAHDDFHGEFPDLAVLENFGCLDWGGGAITQVVLDFLLSLSLSLSFGFDVCEGRDAFDVDVGSVVCSLIGSDSVEMMNRKDS